MPTIFFLHLGIFRPALLGNFQSAETGEYSTGVDTRPFPLTKDGAERKTISRSELIDRGWSKDLIDALLPTKGLDFTVQQLPKPGTKRTSILARYYWVSRVKDM